MKKLVIMPGGFHPFHPGHLSLYHAAQRAFPGADVYIAATNDTSERPFPFAIKEKLAQLAGVAPGHFVQVKSPFQAREITDRLTPKERDDTVLIFVRSQKDQGKPPVAGQMKKDGTPGYLQSYADQGEAALSPITKHAYLAYLPVEEFGGMTSATEIRSRWPYMTAEDKAKLVNVLYPRTQNNKRLTAATVKLLDQGMPQAVKESIEEAQLINDPEGHRIAPSGGMGTWDEATLVSSLARQFTDVVGMLKAKNYTGVEYLLYRAGAIKAKVEALARYAEFMDRQGRRPIAKNKTIDIGEANMPAAGLPADFASKIMALNFQQRAVFRNYINTYNRIQQASAELDKVASGFPRDVIDAYIRLTPEQQKSVLLVLEPSWSERQQQKREQLQRKKQGVAEDAGSWIVYDPETKQIKKRFKTHTAGKSYAQTHGLGFASSEYYFDRIKDQEVDEAHDGSLNEFASAGSGSGGNYFHELARAWYNGAYDSKSLQKGIKSQEDIERLLARGIIGSDGVTRKYAIDYNSDFDGVVISSDDYYEHSDYNDQGQEVDSRTGRPWGPNDWMEFKDDQLSEGWYNPQSFPGIKVGSHLAGEPGPSVLDIKSKIVNAIMTAHRDIVAKYGQKNVEIVAQAEAKKTDPTPKGIQQAVEAVINFLTAGFSVNRLKQQALEDVEDNWDEEEELQNGSYVVDTQDTTGEVFRVSQYEPGARRCWIADRQGRGWYISPDRLEICDDQSRINRYFGRNLDENRGGNYEELNLPKRATDKYAVFDKTLGAIIQTTNDIRLAQQEAIEWAGYDDIETCVYDIASGAELFTVDGYAGAEKYLDESSMSELDIERQDYESMAPVSFQNRYGISKDAWAAKYATVLNPQKAKKIQPKVKKDLDYCPVCRRGNNRCVCETEELEESKRPSAPRVRNFVAKNSKTAGAGTHRDKKRAEKTGDVKHKKDLIPVDESQDYLEEGEVVPFPGKTPPPNLEQAKKYAYAVIDALNDESLADPTAKVNPLRHELRRLGFRLRFSNRGIELVNDQAAWSTVIDKHI